MKTIKWILALIMTISVAACHTTKEVGPQVAAPSMPSPGAGTNMLPKAVVYKTNGNYNDNVIIQLSADGTSVVAYPDPRDVSANSVPIEIGDGWLLDRRGGIGANTAFLSYTYPEYEALPKVPSISELKSKIIPGAKVTEVKVLPITLNEALANPKQVIKYVK